MSNIIPFQFDALSVRVITDERGEPWFVGKDVCTVLGYSNPNKAMGDHCRGVTNRYPIVDSLGRPQEVRVLSEPDVLRLIINSKLPAAEAFERWVFEEVLPSIRKTGSYSAPKPVAPVAIGPEQDKMNALLALGAAVASWPGVKPGLAAAATLAMIAAAIPGTPTEHLRRALPPADEPLDKLNATQLGKLCNRSGKTMNLYLANCGLQLRNERDEWVLTEAGSKWAEAIPFARNGHSGYQILWNREVLETVLADPDTP